MGPGPRRVTFLLYQPFQFTGGFPVGYYELVAAGGAARLRIHLARLGAIHALHLIWTHGGFTPTDAPPDAPARSPFDLTFKDEANQT